MPALAPNEAMGLGDIVAMMVSGADLRAICEHSVSDLPCDLDAEIPRSARWPGNAFLQVSGLRMTVDLGRPRGQQVTALTVAGAEVEPERRYSVATSGFLARGYSGFRWLGEGAARRLVGAEEELLRAALRNPGPLPERDGRLQMKGI